MTFLLLTLVTAISLCIHYGIKGYSPYFALLLILAAFLFTRVITLYRNSIKKIKYMFDAIDNNDFTFRYTATGQPSDDRLINELMNRIIRTMLQSKKKAFTNKSSTASTSAFS